MFFDSWDSLARILLIGSLAYIGTIFLMRISGNRTLSKMNSFDLVITVAFGSSLATVLIDDKVTLAEGLTVIGLLVALQFVITWLSVRSSWINSMVKTQPTLLLSEGRFLHYAMKKVRVTEDEVRSVVRQKGLGGVEQAAAVVLESDGSMSVIGTHSRGSLDALQGVRGYKDREKGAS